MVVRFVDDWVEDGRCLDEGMPWLERAEARDGWRGRLLLEPFILRLSFLDEARIEFREMTSEKMLEVGRR